MMHENRDKLGDAIEMLKSIRMGSTVGEVAKLDVAIGVLMEIMTPDRKE